jgi:hypothetical protein
MSIIEAPVEAPERPGESAALPDKLVVKFAGAVVLDRTDPGDQAIFRSLDLGHDVSLQIEGRCLRRAATQLTDREGELTGTKVEANVTVHSIYSPPES